MSIIDELEGKAPEQTHGQRAASSPDDQPSPTTVGDKKQQRHREIVAILLGVVGLIVAYYVYRQYQNAQANAAGTTGVAGAAPGDVSALPATSQPVTVSGGSVNVPGISGLLKTEQALLKQIEKERSQLHSINVDLLHIRKQLPTPTKRNAKQHAPQGANPPRPPDKKKPAPTKTRGAPKKGPEHPLRVA